MPLGSEDTAEHLRVRLAQVAKSSDIRGLTGYGCPDRVLCEETGTCCHVTHCGKGSCHGCPEPFPELLQLRSRAGFIVINERFADTLHRLGFEEFTLRELPVR